MKLPGLGCDARICAWILLWYASSVVTSLSTKEILRGFPFPITVAAVQQAVAVGCGFLNAHSVGTPGLPSRDQARQLAPIALAMVVTLIAYRWSLLTISVALAHIIKALGPLFTICFSWSRPRCLRRFCIPASQPMRDSSGVSFGGRAASASQLRRGSCGERTAGRLGLEPSQR